MANEEEPGMAMPATELPDSAPEDILDAFEELGVPEGYRAELIEGEIVVSPPGDGEHDDIVIDIGEQIRANASVRLFTRGNKGLAVGKDRLIPDGTVAPPYHFRPHGSWAPVEGVEMVIEVTSGRGARDRQQKRQAYAKADIPLYLLIDRMAREAVLFSTSADGEYHAQLRQPFGKGLDLPAPFSFTLDTAEFG